MFMHNFNKPIILGDTTTHGGIVITASSEMQYSLERCARSGDSVFCPQCGGIYKIEEDVLNQSDNRSSYAIEGQRTSCGATLVSRQRLGLIRREDGRIDSVFSDPSIHDICEKINQFKSDVIPNSLRGVFSHSEGSSSSQFQAERQKQAEDVTKTVKTAFYVDLKNEDSRLNEYLPFKVSVYPMIYQKPLSGEKAYAGHFPPGTYTLIIEPTPPSGENLGPVPYINNPKFRRNITLSGDEHYLPIIVTRKESIEHNIMMTFLVENDSASDPETSWIEFPFFAENDDVQEYIHKYAKEFNLNTNLVNAICYIETTHGWYDRFPEALNIEAKSIRPMNVNFEYWKKLFSAKGITRDSLKNKDINVREGCFMLHRVFIRAEPKTILAVSSLYNSHKAKYILEYGYHIQRAYNKKLWTK